MKKVDFQKLIQRRLEISGQRLTAKERKALQADVKLLNQQADRLGVLDSMDVEPAMIYFPEGRKR